MGNSPTTHNSFKIIISHSFRAISFTIRLGSNSLVDSDPNRVTVASSHYVAHPDYDPLTLEHNIGLIALRLPIQFTSKTMLPNFHSDNQ
jgi:hypothetical protein